MLSKEAHSDEIRTKFDYLADIGCREIPNGKGILSLQIQLMPCAFWTPIHRRGSYKFSPVRSSVRSSVRSFATQSMNAKK